jgi:hypothetical protein
MGVLNMVVPGRRSMKTAAVMGAANWAMRRYGGRTGAKASRALNTATWAVPLGLMALNYVRDRRDGA